MDRSINTLLWCAGFTLMGLAIVAIPLFLFLWIVATFKSAVSHTIELGLVFGLGYAGYQLMRSETTASDRRIIGGFVVVGLLLIAGYAWYAWYANNQRIEHENAQALSLSTPSKIDPAVQRDSYCRSVGVKYGRGAARSLHGLSVDPQDDIEIPAECQNLPSTASGIRQGMKQ